jgi:hypothetical protein
MKEPEQRRVQEIGKNFKKKRKRLRQNSEQRQGRGKGEEGDWIWFIVKHVVGYRQNQCCGCALIKCGSGSSIFLIVNWDPDLVLDPEF